MLYLRFLGAYCSPSSLIVSKTLIFNFGFKSGQSTDICTHTLKSTVDYYRHRGSRAFVCFYIDYTKAFDTVNYWKLFLKIFTILVTFMTILHLIMMTFTEKFEICLSVRIYLFEDFINDLNLLIYCC